MAQPTGDQAPRIRSPLEELLEDVLIYISSYLSVKYIL